jgi:hypothetical protein
LKKPTGDSYPIKKVTIKLVASLPHKGAKAGEERRGTPTSPHGLSTHKPTHQQQIKTNKNKQNNPCFSRKNTPC